MDETSKKHHALKLPRDALEALGAEMCLPAVQHISRELRPDA